MGERFKFFLRLDDRGEAEVGGYSWGLKPIVIHAAGNSGRQQPAERLGVLHPHGGSKGGQLLRTEATALAGLRKVAINSASHVLPPLFH